MRVLVTRPTNVATELAEKISAMGDIAELFPTVDIQQTPNRASLQCAIDKLNTQDMAIFVSRSAVQFGMPAIQARWPILPHIVWAAIGPGTANALYDHGISKVLVPEHPPYESESLLALPTFQSLHKKHIYLFRGNGGRELLSDTLSARGATVQAIEVYQRCLPTFNQVERIQDWHHTPNNINVIVTTSADCLHNLMLLVGDAMGTLKEIPIVVVGARMYKLAKELKFKHPMIATGADDGSIIKVLKAFKDNHV